MARSTCPVATTRAGKATLPAAKDGSHLVLTWRGLTGTMDAVTGNGRPRILIVEDDKAIRESLERALRLEDYAVALAGDGAKGLEAAKDPALDLIILDVMMPYVDGLTMCRELRRRGVATPVLMLTARDEVGDRVAGLDAGADDYLVKPFALEELLARLRALLRRSTAPAGRVLRVGDLEMDPAARTVHRGDRQIDLTKTEFDLLELLVEHAGVVLSRDQIYEHVWGYDFATSSNSLDVYVGYLRRKTESGGEPRLIHTVRGVGYVARRGG